MLVAAAALAVLAALSALTPALILVLLFVIGCGSAAGAATWQTLQPELVPPEIRTEAIALGSVNQNLARAVGPALGGLLLAGTSAALVFGVNAVSFVAVLFAVAATAIPRRPLPVPREHVVDAVRAGGRYVAYSPTLLSLIARTAAFIFPAGAIWALLPLVARDKLALGSTGYGILLRCVGIGAFVAATLGLALRRRLSLRALYVLAGMVIAATAALLAVSTSSYLDASGLIVAGAAWITGLGLLGASYQEEMPPWVNARGSPTTLSHSKARTPSADSASGQSPRTRAWRPYSSRSPPASPPPSSPPGGSRSRPRRRPTCSPESLGRSRCSIRISPTASAR